MKKVIYIYGNDRFWNKEVCEILKRQYNLKLEEAKMTTTRLPRENEDKYEFVTKEAFETAIQKNEVFEYNEYLGNYYGTMHSQIKQIHEKGKDVLFLSSLEGIKDKGQYKILSFYIVSNTIPSVHPELSKDFTYIVWNNDLNLDAECIFHQINKW